MSINNGIKYSKFFQFCIKILIFVTAALCHNASASGMSTKKFVAPLPLTYAITSSSQGAVVSGSYQALAVSGATVPVVFTVTVTNPNTNTAFYASLKPLTHITDSKYFNLPQSACGSTLAAQSTCTITVVYQPTTVDDPSSMTERLFQNYTIADGTSSLQDQLQPIMIVLPVGPAFVGVQSASGAYITSVNFPSTVLGQSYVFPIQVVNVGGGPTQGLAYHFSSTGNAAGTNFQVATVCPGFSSLVGQVVGQTMGMYYPCPVTVQFNAPNVAGTYKDTLTFSYLDGLNSTPQTISIQLTGVSAPGVIAPPSPLTYSIGSSSPGANVGGGYETLGVVGSSSPITFTTTVTNPNTNPNYSAAIGKLTHYSETKEFGAPQSNCGSVLAAQTSCQLSVTFQQNPTTNPSEWTDRLFQAYTISIGATPYKWSLYPVMSIVAVGPAMVQTRDAASVNTISALAFSSIAPHQSEVLPFTVVNVGGGPAQQMSYKFSSTGAGHGANFQIASACSGFSSLVGMVIGEVIGTLHPCTVTARFNAPSTTGTYTDTVTFSYLDGVDSTPQTISLSLSGVVK